MSFEYENGFAAKLAWTWAARPSLKIMTRIATEEKEEKGARDGCAMDAAHFGLVVRVFPIATYGLLTMAAPAPSPSSQMKYRLFAAMRSA